MGKRTPYRRQDLNDDIDKILGIYKPKNLKEKIQMWLRKRADKKYE